MLFNCVADKDGDHSAFLLCGWHDLMARIIALRWEEVERQQFTCNQTRIKYVTCVSLMAWAGDWGSYDNSVCMSDREQLIRNTNNDRRCRAGRGAALCVAPLDQ